MASRLWIPLLLIAVAFLITSWFATSLYDNYLKNPILFIVPLLAVFGLILTEVFIVKASWWKAWFALSLTIVSATLFGVVGLYPNLFPSSLNPAYNLTIYNSSSSPLTLKIMLGVALFFVPIIIIYQAWVYNMFKHKVTEEDLIYEEAY